MLRSIALAVLLLHALLWTVHGSVTPINPVNPIALGKTGVPSETLAHFAIYTPQVIQSASQITVTTMLDEVHADGNCSLREAIQAANEDRTVDQCTAGSGNATIHLPTGVYLLAAGELTLTSVITIQGSITQGSVVDGNFGSRVFYIAPNARVTLSHLDIRNGVAPGQVDADVAKVVIGEGGGILNHGTTRILFSTIHDNRAGLKSWDLHGGADGADGGGIYNAHSLTIINSTISGNVAGHGYGGLSHGGEGGRCSPGGQGGAIANHGTLRIVNSTLANNQPGTRNGPCGPDLTLYLQNRTGGVYTWSATRVQVENSILADNVGRDCDQSAFSVAAGCTLWGNNLIQNSASCVISGTYVHWGAHLGPLQDNDGPTPTHALAPNSPAIDAGGCLDSTGMTAAVDQRGQPRPQGDNCDIGAYESPYTSTFVIKDTALPLITRNH